MTPLVARCHITVTWAALGITVRCVRPQGHGGAHRDGVWWFDDNGLQVDGECHVHAVRSGR